MSLFGRVMQFFGFTESGKSSDTVIEPPPLLDPQPVVNLDETVKNIRMNLKEAKEEKNTPGIPGTLDTKIQNVNDKQKQLRDKSKKCSSNISNIIEKVASYPERRLRGSKVAPEPLGVKELADETNVKDILLVSKPKDPIGKKIKKLISDTIAVDAQEEVVAAAKLTSSTATSANPEQVGKLSEIAESSLQKSKIMYEQDTGDLLSEFQDDLCKDYNEIGEELEDQLYQEFLEYVIPQTSDNIDNIPNIAETVQTKIDEEVSAVIKEMGGQRILKLSDHDLDDVAQSVTKKLTKFWLKKLKDNPVDSSIWKVIFKRTAVNIAALGAYDVFNSHCNTQDVIYYAYAVNRYEEKSKPSDNDTIDEKNTTEKLSERIGGILKKIPLPSNYKSVVIGDYKFTVGPIVDTAKFIGRTFVYVKCELNDSKKIPKKDNEMGDRPLDHFYFWVYLSQSEGMFRVFFMLYAQFAIEKGVDYTQATLVHFKLQKILNEYYNTYYNKVNPTVINTLGGVNHFILNMSYLHDDEFFRDLVRAQEHDNMFMGIDMLTTYDTRDYYIVDSPSLLSKGMPLDAVENPEDYSYKQNHQRNYARVMTSDIEKYKDIQNNPVRTYPLVVCFSTVVFKSPPASMSALLNPFFYNNTFWVQGARNYTTSCSILSPVLFTVMGSSLLYPDYELSRMRSEIMNTQGYKDANFVSMTSMELFISQNNDFNVYLPNKTARTSFSNARNAIFKEIYENMAKYETIDVGLIEDPDYVPISEFSPIDLPENQKDPSKITATKICDWLSGNPNREKFEGEHETLLTAFQTKNNNLFIKLQRIMSNQSTRNTFETNLAVIGDFSNKRNFLYSMFDNAYNICNGLLNCDESNLKLYYLSEGVDSSEWIKTDNNLNVLNPTDPGVQKQPYIFESKFSEIKNSVSVTVHTLAHIYALQIPYTEVLETAASLRPEDLHKVKQKSMYMIFQISSTIVYSSVGNILYGIDMQKTPIACLPDLDVAVPTGTDTLESIFTSLGTFKRYSAWGAFFASKMMEYLGNYNQLPSLFKEFPEILQVCETYTTTAPFFNYNNIKPYSFIKIPRDFSFSQIFQTKVLNLQNLDYIRSNTDSIEIFTKIFINPFVKQFDENELFVEEEDTDDEHGGGTIIVSTTNNENPEDNIDIEVIEIKKKNKGNKRLVKQRLFEIYMKTGKIPKPKYKSSLSHVNRNVQKQSQSPKHRSKSVKIAKHINLRNTRRVRDGRN
jgi:hypothetical protein